MSTVHPKRAIRNARQATGGWLALQRARLAHRRHPELGEISAYCFYATKLRFGDLAFDIGANHGEHTAQMLNRGARVVAVEPQARLATELAGRFPRATVIQRAVSDQPGTAELHLSSADDRWASLDESWLELGETLGGPARWEASETVNVTTVDELIDEFGQPTVVKIDTEGYDDRALRGLTQPVEHILFEIHTARLGTAMAAFAQLEELGHYEYYEAPGGSWLFRPCSTPIELISRVQTWSDVYARRIDY